MPDKIVREETGRAAVDAVLKAVTKTQEQAGMMRGGQAAEDWAREQADLQVKKHEEQQAREGLDDLKAEFSEEDPADPSPSRLDRGEVPDDAVVINRSLDPATSPLARKHLAPQLDTRPLHDRLLEARLNLLAQFPDWHAKLLQAGEDGERLAMKSGSELDRIDTERRHRFVAAAMLKVVEDSNTVFGDYRFPKPGGLTKIIMVPLGQSAPAEQQIPIITATKEE